jgi:copper chaperone CopZ
VRSALLSIEGVTRAQVALEGHVAIVTYNPRQATVQQMIDVVNQTPGVLPGMQYVASVKPPDSDAVRKSQ